MAKSRLRKFLITAKHGYDTTYWIFVLIGSAAVLGKLFGIAGVGAVIVVFLFFYWMGRIHFRLEEKEAREGK